MGFPIVVGAKSVSSRPLSSPSPIEEYSNDGVHALKPVVVGGGPRVAMAINTQGTLCATITIFYYDMIRPNDKYREMTMIDLKVIVSPMAACSNYSQHQHHRELLHRIPIPDSASSTTNDNVDNSDDASAEEQFANEVRACLVFSSDGRNLDCLLPCPRKGRSVLINLQLRKPLEKHQKQQSSPPLPLPSYINNSGTNSITTTSSSIIVPVATNPRLVKDPHGIPVNNVTTICDASTVPVGQQKQQQQQYDNNTGPPSVLLAGCKDGSILAIGHSHKRTPIAASVVPPSPFRARGESSIVCMKHSAEHGSNDDSSWGKLVTIRTNGIASIFTTHLIWAESSSKGTEAMTNIGIDDPPPTLVTSNLSNRKEEQHQIPPTTTTKNSKQQHRESPSLLIKIDPLTVLEQSLASSATFCNAQWINGHILALLVRPRIGQKDTVQVWSIYEDQSPQRLSTLRMSAERLEEESHGTFYVGNSESAVDDGQGEQEQQQNTDHTSINNSHNDEQQEELDTRSSSTTSNGGPLALHYDIDTGCLAVSSLLVSRDTSSSQSSSTGVNGRSNGQNPVVGKPYVCIWHWLSDVVGITLVGRSSFLLGQCRKSLMSCLHFSSDFQKQGRRRLVHTSAWLPNTYSSKHRIRKEIYPLATLSPSTSLKTNDGCHVQEPSSVLLSSDSVSLPFVFERSSNDDREVEWVESVVPAVYTSKFGPLQLAAVGQRNGNSIAVASSRGICVLRTSPELRNAPKWRLFGSPSEENEFQVITMTWWEMDHHDDLLVAVIQTESGGYYLCCWSPRALDFESQLLVKPSSIGGKESQQQRGTKGLQLPSGFKPSELSLLAEPSKNTSPDEASTQSRAIVMLSSSESCLDGECDYIMFRLQLSTKEHFAKARQPKQLQQSNVAVGCALCSSGKFRLHHWSHEGTCSSVFLAGGSFQFDLGAGQSSSEGKERENDLIATVGVIRTPGLGVDTIVVSSSGPVECAKVIVGVSNDIKATSSQVSKFWLSDVLSTSQSDDEEASSEEGNFFVWIFELCSGRLLSWSVPYFDDSCDTISFGEFEQDALDALIPEPTLLDVTSNLLPPVAVGGSKASSFLMGIACAIGDSSTWMNDPSSSNRSEFTIGSIPGSNFGCILSAGQNARKVHRVVPDNQASVTFATNFLDHEVFGVGDLILMPPAFVASLFASFLGLAGCKVPTEGKRFLQEESSSISDLKRDTFKNHCVARLHDNPNKDCAMMALRLLILRTVESLSEQAKKHYSQKSAVSKRSLTIATSLFSEVIDAARYSATPLQFASLILGVGRQIEPHCLGHLFPLPVYIGSSSEAYSLCPHYKWRTVDELYDGAVKSGSLGISASALPLCLVKASLQKNCAALLIHCLKCIAENSESDSVIRFDTSIEERQSISDLFRYGMKLEDAEMNNSESGNDGWLSNGSIDYSSTSNSNGRSSVSSNGDQFQIVNSNDVPPQRPSSRSRSLFRMFFLPFFWRQDNQKRLEEEAIYEAASSFILSGFEELEIDHFLATTADQNPSPGTAAGKKDKSSESREYKTKICTVSDVVDEFLVSTLFEPYCASHNSSKSFARWKRVFTVARLILGEKHTQLSSSSREMENFHALSTEITMGDLAYSLKGYSTASSTTHGNRNGTNENGGTTTSVTTPRRHPTSSSTMNSNSNNKKEHQPIMVVSQERRTVGNFLVCQILECQHDITQEEASLLVDLILILFSRHTTWNGRYKLPQLLILATIAAHVSERQGDLFETRAAAFEDDDKDHDYEIETSFAMEKCYEYALEELNDTV